MLTSNELFNLAVRYHQGGNLAQAEPLYRQILQTDPANAEAYHLLGLLAHQTGHGEAALSLLRQASALNPAAAGVHFNMGIVLMGQKQFAQAAASFQQTLRRDPGHVEAYINLGNAYLSQGLPADAALCYQQAIRIQPLHADAHINLGNALLAQGNPTAAIEAYRAALQINPQHAHGQANLGFALLNQGQLDEAAICFRAALRMDPANVKALCHLGDILVLQRQHSQATDCYRQVLRIDPDRLQARTHLGRALYWLGQFAEATECFQHVLQINPNHPEALNNLGLALRDQGRIAEAEQAFQRALDLDFGQGVALWNRCLLRLLQGKFTEGWPDFEQRWQLPGAEKRTFQQPRWDGSPLEGKTVLVFAEMGLGDTIHFLRYLPMVKERGGTVLLECQPALIKLLAGVKGVDQLIPAGAALPPFDVQFPLLSVPALFGTTLGTIPADIPYIKASPHQVEHWHQQITRATSFIGEPTATKKAIGIAWQSNVKHQGQCFKSIPLKYFEALARVPNVQIFSLQVGQGTEQLATAKFSVIDLGSRFDPKSLEDLAAVMMNLDLIVTIDTAVAHLAGALGVPVWVALPLVGCWRWQLERSDSPWYPTMRLFRQTKLHDWGDVFERIAAEVPSTV
jgi:tetratricopeptide (TPR) repeat protein